MLQERSFCPVGSHEPLRFRGRVIAATNRPLETLRELNLFRDDFLYRLCSDVVEVPPLRRRLKEEPLELTELLEYMIAGMVGEPAGDLAKKVEDAIRGAVGEDYGWPGNVRELEQAVRRIFLTGNYAGSARPAVRSERDKLAAQMLEGSLAAEELLARYCKILYEQEGSYEAVARRAKLDRRTAKKYVEAT